MNYDHIMVRFGELSTKGKNKKDFIDTLFKNIIHALKSFKNLKFDKRYDHIYVILNGENADEVLLRLQDVSGIYALSLVYKCENDINVIKESALELIKKEEGNTFKINCKRGNKRFPMKSEEITRHVAGNILANVPGLKVDVQAHLPRA